MYRSASAALSILLVALGVAMLVRTLVAGGGPLAVGVVFGVAFCAAGLARLYLTRERG